MLLKNKTSDNSSLSWVSKKAKNQLGRIILIVVGNVLFSVCTVAFALFSKGIIDNAVKHNSDKMIKYAIALFITILIQLLLRIVCNSAEEYVRSRVALEMRQDIFKKLQKKDYSPVAGFHSGELLNRMFSDVTVISDGIAGIIPQLSGMITRVVCAAIVLVTLDKYFALIFIVCGVIMFLLTRLYRSVLKRLHKEVQQKEGKVRSFLQEAMESRLIVKVFGAEDYMYDKSQQLHESHFQSQMKRKKYSVFTGAGFAFVLRCGYLYALIWGTYGIYMATMSYGTLTAILQLVAQIQTPFSAMSGAVSKIYAVLASAERVMELEKLPDEDNNEEINIHGDALNTMEFKNVSFTYGRNNVLDNVSFKVSKGDFVAVTGLSGGGKSTMFLLMIGAYKCTDGDIKFVFDDNELSPGSSTRKLLSYVPQGNYLFSGTLRENIAFANTQATDDEINNAARIACADTFIDELPDKLDTVVGEKGSGLSEGQIQRIAIARAVLNNTPVMLLDEATSALDEITEANVLKNLSQLNGVTCFIVTHRKATLEICNKQIVIDNASAVIKEI